MNLKVRISHWFDKFYQAYQNRKMRDRVVNSHHDVMNLDDDIVDCRKYGFSNAESMYYDLKHNHYQDYISTWESYQPRIKNRFKKYFPISDDKYLFYLVFSHYIKTAECYALIQKGEVMWLRDAVEESLYDFIITHKGLVVKDRKWK